MNRLEAVAGASLVALIGAGLGQQYVKLSRLARTPAPAKQERPSQPETRPAGADAAVNAYLSAVESGASGERLVALAGVLTALEAPEFDGEPLSPVAGESLARAIGNALPDMDGSAQGVELRRRAIGFLAGRVPGITSRDLVLQAVEQGPDEVRREALERMGSPLGVRGSVAYAKIKELGEKGLVPDDVRAQALRRLGGLKAKDELVALMQSTSSPKLITGCAVALQDYKDPELMGPVLERLEQVGRLGEGGKLPWISGALLEKHLETADKTRFRRGLAAIAARPSLVKPNAAHVERALQSPDADTRRSAAIAVKKAVVAKLIDAKQGEAMLAKRLEVETEPLLKAELTGGLERVRSVLAQTPTGVQ